MGYDFIGSDEIRCSQIGLDFVSYNVFCFHEIRFLKTQNPSPPKGDRPKEGEGNGPRSDERCGPGGRLVTGS